MLSSSIAFNSRITPSPDAIAHRARSGVTNELHTVCYSLANAPVFRLRCLASSVDVQVNGRPLRSLRSKKGLWLLAILAANQDREPSRQWLAERLWPELDDDGARKALRQCLWDLRKALEEDADRLAVSQNTVRLNFDDADIDVVTFDRAIRCRDHATLAEAVAIYNGPFLDGCDEPWAINERATRHREVMQSLEHLAQHEERNFEFATAAEYWRRATELDPQDEAMLRGLMVCLGKLGNQALAIEAFRSFESFLRKRDPLRRPDEKTLEVYRTARAAGATERDGAPSQQAASPAAIELPPRDPLPQPLTDMVGRDESVESIATLLRKRRLVTLTGVGGVGKTRLALAIGGEVESRYRDGAAFVNLASVNEPSLVSAAISSALGLPDYPELTSTASVLASLRRSDILLIIDNCEHVIDAAAHFVEQLLGACIEVRVLATSREPLRVAGERSIPVAPLSCPDEQQPADEIVKSPSVQLLIERLEDAGVTSPPIDEVAVDLARICRRLDGIPLALELAAVAGASMSLSHLASSLDRRLSVLMTGRRSATSRHQTLRATIEWSYGLLSDQEREMLRRLSVFDGGWSQEAAEQVCGSSSSACPIHEVVNLLNALVGKSLVVYDALTCHYTMLETIREFATEQMCSEPELLTLQERHCNYFRTHATSNPTRDRRSISRNLGNLRAAVQWCLSRPGQAEAAVELCSTYMSVLHIPGVLRDANERMREVLSTPDMQGAHAARMKALWVAGYIQLKGGNTAAVKHLYCEALDIGDTIGNNAYRADVLRHLAEAEQMEGDLESALGHLHEARHVLGNSDNIHAVGWVLIQMSQIAEARSDVDAAEEYVLQAGAVWDRGPETGIEIISHRLASIALTRGDREQALELISDARAKAMYPWCDELEVTARIAMAYGKPNTAAILHGAMLGLLEPLGQVSAWKRRLAPQQEAVRQCLGPLAFADAVQQGRRMSTGDAVDLALADIIS